MQDQVYTNRFVDVHEKVKIFKDRLRRANNRAAQDRDNRLVQEAKEIIDKKPTPS